MKKAQVKLLKGYGWSDKQVSDFLQIPKSSVPMYLKEDDSHDLVQVLPPEPGNDHSYTDGLRTLKTHEVGKQLELAPIIGVIELTLLQKVKEMADNVDVENPKAVKDVVETFKRLSADSVVNVVKADKDTPNAQANVVVALKFND